MNAIVNVFRIARKEIVIREFEQTESRVLAPSSAVSTRTEDEDRAGMLAYDSKVSTKILSGSEPLTVVAPRPYVNCQFSQGQKSHKHIQSSVEDW